LDFTEKTKLGRVIWPVFQPIEMFGGLYYDLMWSKEIDDLERFAKIITENDPFGHLISIHNCIQFYDYNRTWITHCSVQRIDVYKTAESTDEWRKQWNKPIVIDECVYE
jgi:hypothetical protein